MWTVLAGLVSLNTWSAAALGGCETFGIGRHDWGSRLRGMDLEVIAQPTMPNGILCWHLAQSHSYKLWYLVTDPLSHPAFPP